MILPSLRRGRRAERRAARLLRRAGLVIVARNVRAGRGDIDLVARDGDVVVLVEVRERADGVLAADLSVGPEKAARLRRTWTAVRRRYRLPDLPVRCDLVLFGGGTSAHLVGLVAIDPPRGRPGGPSSLP